MVDPPVEYVLPLKWSDHEDLREITTYLRDLRQWADVTVVDGSAPGVFAHHHEQWASIVRHLPPEPWAGRNGKVAGVVTGLRYARHEHVVIADDDVRWDRDGLACASRLLQAADLVRPQNVFTPMPWHARWDTARSLVNRAFGADYPGTYAVRRETFLAAGGYDGDVLFENLEMSRTLRAVGAVERYANSLFVARRPPTVQHFLGQRVRQAYDDLAQPGRLAAECALLPSAAVMLAQAVCGQQRRQRAARMMLLTAAIASLALGEHGRRRAGGAAVFPATAALWTPLWSTERAVCVWVALAHRVHGGTPYADQRIKVAAHSLRWLRRHRGDRPPLAPAYLEDDGVRTAAAAAEGLVRRIETPRSPAGSSEA